MILNTNNFGDDNNWDDDLDENDDPEGEDEKLGTENWGDAVGDDEDDDFAN